MKAVPRPSRSRPYCLYKLILFCEAISRSGQRGRYNEKCQTRSQNKTNILFIITCRKYCCVL